MKYVRLTYTPYGGKKTTVWAEKDTVNNGVARYWKVNRFGKRPEPMNLILLRETEGVVEPAVLYRLFGVLKMLKVVK